MFREEPKQHLLPLLDDLNLDEAELEHVHHNDTGGGCARRPFLGRPPYAGFASLKLGLLILSLLGNAFLLYQYSRLKHAPELCHSSFSGLGYDRSVTYHTHTDYGGNNDTLADELWEAIDSSPIVVALTDDYAIQHGLETSARFPWDDEKGIYHVKAFHHLHCLKSLRKAYTDMQRGNLQIVPTAHFHHCLDTLRQDLMCLADDTLMPTINTIHQIGNGQVRQCRDWDKLVAWTQEPERHACFRMLDDYRKVPNTLEEFAFCNKDSQYYSVAEAYFEENGHRNPYGT